MVHPGLSAGWVIFVVSAILLTGLYFTWSPFSDVKNSGAKNFKLVILSQQLKSLVTTPWLLLVLRIVTSAVFLLVIYAGLFGTAIPEKNIATVLTWTIWWSGVVISIFFVGSAWCAICPWDALAGWLVKRKLWQRGDAVSSLNLRVPKIFRSVWPALIMFIGLTWLELGVGVTVSPYATALMALLMVVLATISLAVYERKAFCHYFCAVGRTIGAYSVISPVALRPVNENTCADCTTLECYHGTDQVEPCPTHLVMGRIKQNTYCTSCGACGMSCPHQNVSWQIRNIATDVINASPSTSRRAKADEAWFVLGLVALTTFHGITMMPYWESWMQQLAYKIGDSGQLLISFSVGMFVSMLIPVSLYYICVYLVKLFSKTKESFERIFSLLAVSLIPLAFAYHIAHNLTHLVRESQGFWNVVMNPLGTDALPFGMHELHMRHMNPVIADDIVFSLQALLIVFGFYIAVSIVRKKMALLTSERFPLLIAVIFIGCFSLLNLWLLMQPMIMRM